MTSRIYPGNFNKPFSDEALSISRGMRKGYSYVHKFGEAPDIDSGDGFVDIWDGGALNIALKTYTFSTTADIDMVSSSSASDVMDIEVQGLDTNWDLVVQTVTLTGQTPVTLPTPLIRVFRMKNVGSVDCVGNIYCFVNGTTTGGVPDTITDTRAVIRDGNNQTLMAIYTVPAGYTAYMYSYDTYISKKGTVDLDFHREERPFGGVFQLKHTGAANSQGRGGVNVQYHFPHKIAAKTDIKVSADSDVNNTGASATFELLLVKDDVA